MLLSERAYPVILFFLWLVVHLFLFSHYGVRTLFDSHDYIAAADYLFQHGSLEDKHHFFYFLPVTILSLSRFFFPNEVLPFLIFQTILSCVALFALYASTSRLFHTKVAGFITGLIFLFWWDNLHWNTTVMTESLACTAECGLIYLLASFRPRAVNYLQVLLALLVCFFIRPSGIILILATIAFLIHAHWHHLQYKPALQFIFYTSIFVIGMLGANLLFERWDFTDQLKRGNIITYIDTLKGQKFYSEMLQLKTDGLALPNTRQPVLKMVMFIILNPWYFFKSSLLKVLLLLSFMRPYYSPLHNIFSFAYVATVYWLYVIGFQKTSGPLRTFTVFVIFITCVLTAISSTDWDNRFFMPMEPCLVLLAGGGGYHLIKKMQGYRWVSSKND